MEGRPLEEAELIDRSKRGDTRAYAELVRRYQDIAGRTAVVITGRSADAQDAVQEAFIRAYRALPRFRSDAPFRPWLLRIVANEAINLHRASRRDANLQLRLRQTRPEGDAAPSPEGAALERERNELLARAVSRLRPEDRMVIAYRYWFGFSEGEMAEALGCARGTVKSRLSRALGRLRRELGGARAGEALAAATDAGGDAHA